MTVIEICTDPCKNHFSTHPRKYKPISSEEIMINAIMMWVGIAGLPTMHNLKSSLQIILTEKLQRKMCNEKYFQKLPKFCHSAPHQQFSSI